MERQARQGYSKRGSGAARQVPSQCQDVRVRQRRGTDRAIGQIDAERDKGREVAKIRVELGSDSVGGYRSERMRRLVRICM